MGVPVWTPIEAATSRRQSDAIGLRSYPRLKASQRPDGVTTRRVILVSFFSIGEKSIQETSN